MELVIYLKTLILFSLLFICGIIIIRRATEEKRAQLLIPSGAIAGIALYIFLINLVAHLIKGVPGFYLSLVIEICIAILIKRFFNTRPMEFPKGKLKILVIISFATWTLFLYKIIASSMFSGDVVYYYSLASLFLRGDYPMHAPWQPDYVMYYHFGGAQFLGAVRAITGAPYLFIHQILAIFMLVSWSQILTWLINKTPIKFSSLLIFSIPAIVGIISLGGFMITWPANLGPVHFDGNIFQWLSQLPTLNNSQETYGSPTNLDMLVNFLHRFLSISFFFCLIPVLISPKKGNYFLLLAFITTLISSIALVDESVLFVIYPAIIIVSFFSLFNRSIVKTLPLGIISISIACLQGGIITESIFNSQSNSGILFFAEDSGGYRFRQILSRLFDNKPNYQPFRWFHPGIIWQLLFLSLITLYQKFSMNKLDDQNTQKKLILQPLLWLLLISSITSLIAYFAIVPKLFSLNGTRFLILSYYFSGIGIAFYLIYWWFTNKRRLLLLRSLIIWILLFSFIPAFFFGFPRPRTPNLLATPEPESASFNWIRNNLPIQERILVLTQSNVATIANMGLAIQVGAFTPMWDLTPKVEAVFDMSPLYADAYYTLNPNTLSILKINYLIISNNYLSQLTEQRYKDLQNRRYFQPVFTDIVEGEEVLKVTPEYFKEGSDLNGTFSELSKIAPKKGTYYIEYTPNIPENMFRALRVLLFDKDVYYPIGAAFYNGTINVNITQHNTLLENYNYLVLATTTDPKTICNCKATLLWTGLGNGIRLWKTNLH